jgi:hypothetical protein
MVIYPPSLKAVGGARTGIAPANLLDVLDVNGNIYYWADRYINAPVAITGALQGYGVPPVAVPPGQSVAWAYPTDCAVVTDGDTTANAGDLRTMSINGQINAELQATSSHSFNPTSSLTWSGFQVPPLPANAVIKAIYPVMFVTLDTEACSCNPSVTFGAAPISEGQFYAGSIGDSLGAITSATWNWQISATADIGPISATALFSFVGLAIYYEGSGGEPGWNFPGEAAYGAGPYLPWLVQVPPFTFHRSLVTDIGAFVIQNLSGDTLSRDFEKIARRSALEGAFFVYRCWQADAQASWLEVHGTLTMGNTGDDTAQLKGAQLINASEADTPLEIYCETCQIQWAGRRCGSTEDTECQYSYQTCQVIERPFIVQNNFEKNLGESAAAITTANTINRRRKI